VNNPLATYMHDHLAGAAYALDLLEALEDHYKTEPLGQLAAKLYRDISSDRDTLQDVARRFGPGSNKLKEGAAWLSEKVSRIKVQHSDPSGLGTFEALEFLELGIHGKLALWRALAQIANREKRLEGIDFANLMSRAQNQEALVEKFRLAAAESTFLANSA
jgi:hypothetical protein